MDRDWADLENEVSSVFLTQILTASVTASSKRKVQIKYMALEDALMANPHVTCFETIILSVFKCCLWNRLPNPKPQLRTKETDGAASCCACCSGVVSCLCYVPSLLVLVYSLFFCSIMCTPFGLIDLCCSWVTAMRKRAAEYDAEQFALHDTAEMHRSFAQTMRNLADKWEARLPQCEVRVLTRNENGQKLVTIHREDRTDSHMHQFNSTTHHLCFYQRGTGVAPAPFSGQVLQGPVGSAAGDWATITHTVYGGSGQQVPLPVHSTYAGAPVPVGTAVPGTGAGNLPPPTGVTGGYLGMAPVEMVPIDRTTTPYYSAGASAGYGGYSPVTVVPMTEVATTTATADSGYEKV